VSSAAITLCIASRRVFIVASVVYFLMTQFGNFWIHPRTNTNSRNWQLNNYALKTYIVMLIDNYKTTLTEVQRLYNTE
jgi:hypothetical protein